MNTRDSALDLARRGLRVFPCHRDKRPATNRGLYDATSDPKSVQRFQWHDRLIGVPTGAISKLVVLDIDIRKDVNEWAIASIDKLPATRAHITRSGGAHLVFRHPGYKVANSAGRIADGVDVRGDGGYIIWWPAHGGEVINGDISLGRLPLWPGWLNPPPPKPRATSTLPSRIRRSELQGVLEFVAASRHGERNTRLFWAACRLGEAVVAGGIDEPDALELLVEAAGIAGLDKREAERTALSGLATGAHS